MRKSLFLLTLLCCLFGAEIAFAQRSAAYSTTNKKAIKAYQASENYMVRRQWEQVIQLLEEAVDRDEDFMEARVRLATAYRALGLLDRAVAHLEKAAAPDKGTPAPEALFALGELYWQLGRYLDAKSVLTAFQATNPRQKPLIAATAHMLQSADFAIEQLKNPLPFDPQPLPQQINQYALQYFPVLTVDGRTLIFTRRIGADPAYDENILVATKNENGEWQEAESISEMINTLENEGTTSISADGRTLIFTSCQGRRSYGSCDLYITTKTGNKWSEPQNLGAMVNSRDWESQPALSADGRLLYFVSDRPGGSGRMDIWVSERGEDGKWQEAKNLGTTINTSANEMSPFIHANGSTLYFSSNGHIGMGGYDLYLAEQDTAAGWQQVQNLGYPINTSKDQVSLFVAADGKQGFYAHEEKQGDRIVSSKLYSFELPEAVQVKNRSSYVTGRVYDAQTKKPIGATVQLYDLNTKEMEQQVGADAQTGLYYMVLTEGAPYGLYVSEPGYLFKSLSFEVGQEANLQPVQLDVYLDPIKAGMITRLSNIFFDTDKHAIKPKSETELQRVVHFLQQNPTVRIEIAGHTDDVGNAAYNQQLSEKRARAVYQWLTENGVSSERLKAKGYGQSKPQVPNTTEENRQQNRRIEFSIL